MRIRLTNWRLWLLLGHRWTGIAIGIMVAIWALSGFVLMYFGLPHLHAGERLSRLPPLETIDVNIAPAEAVAHAGDGEAFRIRLSMHGDRPVYRVNTGRVFGRWTLVYADTGEVVENLDAARALDWLAAYVPEAAGSMTSAGRIDGPDLYTHNPGIQNHMPMHRIALNDPAGTIYYVSASSGEAVMKTDRIGRLLGFLGYELHTLFFFRQKTWWSGVLQVLAWSGLVMALLGLWLGMQRFSLTPRFARRGIRHRSPYSGLMQWHHYAGLLFGVAAIVWVFSGLVSMGSIPGVVETLYTPSQIAAGARSVQGEGPRLALDGVTSADVRRAAAAIAAEFPISEIELISFAGELYFLAYRRPTADEARDWQSRSAFDFISPTLDHDHRLIAAADADARPVDRFTDEIAERAARQAMPDATIVKMTWHDTYDDFYYERHTSFDLGLPQPVKTLPVLRVEYDDPLGTWLYVSPSHGQILKFESRDRANRWGYYGLHAFDFAFLFRHRPLWDIAVLILLGGVAVLSTTTLLPMLRRLRRHAARTMKRFT